MRVTHIITRLVIGGAQENTVATVLGLREKAGMRVDLISGPTTGPEGSLEPSLKGRQEITRVPSLVRPVHPWKDTRAFWHLTALLRRFRSDIVHTHSGKAGFLGRLAARKARIPVVLHHIHGPSFGPFQGPVPNALFLAAERYAGKRTSHFLCSAQAMARLYLDAGIGSETMYTRIFSGFKIENFLAAQNDMALRLRLGLERDSFVIGKIARLAPLKGHEDLLIAAGDLIREMPQARLLFVGDGPLRGELETLVVRLGLKGKVIFAGLVSPSEVAVYAGIMDCVAHLSYREALSRALPQALAAAKPIIAYDFDGADEVCLEGKTGFLVRAGDIASVTRHLRVLATHPEERLRLGTCGQQFVQKEFRVEDMVEKIHALYVRFTKVRDPEFA